jgi:hypothetical protein
MNMTGTDKLPLLAIGRFKNPRAFNGATIPLDYEANKKAWMTRKFYAFYVDYLFIVDVFENWIHKWDQKLQNQKRKVLLFVDNFSAHKISIELKNIELQFFPANTTARVQVIFKPNKKCP